MNFWTLFKAWLIFWTLFFIVAMGYKDLDSSLDGFMWGMSVDVVSYVLVFLHIVVTGKIPWTKRSYFENNNC